MKRIILALVAFLFVFSSPVFAADTVDQSNTGSYTNYFGLRNGSNDGLAQKFSSSISGYLTKITVHIWKNGSPTGNVWVGIYSNNSGNPGTSLCSSSTIDVSTLSGSGGEDKNFTYSGCYITSGTDYWVVYLGDYSPSGSNFSYWYVNQNTGFTIGKSGLSGSWSNVTESSRFIFTEYYDPAITPTPTIAPTGQPTQAPATPSGTVWVEMATNSAIGSGLRDLVGLQYFYNVLIIFVVGALFVLTVFRK